MLYDNEIKELIFKFENLGMNKSSNGATLIGKAPFNGNSAWLNIIYPTLDEKALQKLEKELLAEIPEEYRAFLTKESNGLNILSSTFSLYGFRPKIDRNPRSNIRQPYTLTTPNIFERPENAKESYFFIGGYNWDGSHLYIDKKTRNIHCCERWDATSKYHWSSFNEMLLSELKRLYTLFDDEGKEYDDEKKTIPY